MGVKRCPEASWKPLGKQKEPAMTGHDLVIVHTMVGYLHSTDTMFRAGGYDGTESHYGIGGRWGSDASRDLDGVIWQWQDRGRQADANLAANPTAISIETADNAPVRAADIARWTPAQAEALVTLLTWECSAEAHAGCPSSWTCHGRGIPASLVPDSRPGRRGVAYHRQGVDPWRVSGGQRWSPSRGKECPGPARITQLTSEIIPAVRARQKGETMPLTKDDVRLNWTGVKVVVNENDPTPDDPTPNWTPAQALAKADTKLDNLGSRTKNLVASMAALEQMVVGLRSQEANDFDAVNSRIDALNSAVADIARLLKSRSAS